jgi:6-pyruvoyltetrahydropterin/6-carboxytetrahydropterin synthase
MTQSTQDDGCVCIHISRDYFTFSSAHFLLRADGTSEPLHGHNYSVTAQVQGPVDHLGYIVDFALLKSLLLPITHELNHRVLLPGESDRVTINCDGNEAMVQVDASRYLFPLSNIAILPVRNTTCEELAAYIGLVVLAHLPGGRLELTVEENPGQGASWRSSDDGR